MHERQVYEVSGPAVEQAASGVSHDLTIEVRGGAVLAASVGVGMMGVTLCRRRPSTKVSFV